MKDLIDRYNDLRDSLSVAVKIDYSQILKVVVRDLIRKRNSCIKRNNLEAANHFDCVLTYYLGEDDFDKYVIRKSKINP